MLKSFVRAVALTALVACGGANAPDAPTAPVGTLSIDGDSTLLLGDSRQLVASFQDAATKAISHVSATWKTTDATVVAVASDGTVTGVGVGVASVTASAGGRTASMNVIVTARRIQFVRKGPIVDTIESKPPDVTVLVLDARGQPMRDASVRFELYGSLGFVSQFPETTDSDGHATAHLAATWNPGTTQLHAKLVTGFTVAAEDSVPFTILPGAPAAVSIAPRDSAAYMGAGYTIAATAVDRRRNVLPNAVTLSTDSGATAAKTDSAGKITTLAMGRARMIARVAGTNLTDTARITVVPSGKLAWSGTAGGVGIVNLDGSGRRVLVPGARAYPFESWSPDGNFIVYSDGQITSSRLFRVDMQGAVTPLSSATPMPSETWPRYSYDGQSIYFTGGYYPDSLDTYRMKSDGTGPRTRVTPLRPGSTRYWHASPSPDGTLLAYSDAGYEALVLDMAKRTELTLYRPSFRAEAPRFSPQGDWIAYSSDDDHEIYIVHPDGFGFRKLTPTGVYADHWGHDWSPDGEWIVFSSRDGLSIVRLTDRLVLPLPYSAGMYSPAWHQ